MKTKDNCKKSLLDKIWPKKSFEVNGKVIQKPRSKKYLIAFLVILFTVFMFVFIPLDSKIRFDQLGVIIRKLFDPANGKTGSWSAWFNYMIETLVPLMIETINMCLLGTLFGSLVAIPFSIFASRNICKRKFVNQISRLIMNFIRTIPTYVLAVIGMLMYGFGVVPGIFALSIFSFGIMGKMFYEQIETVDMGPFESLEATGANKTKAFKMAVVPQILPVFLGYFIYILEMNVRGSVILGYVGAGGIGQELSVAIESRYYDRVGAIIVFMFVIVLILQFLTNYVRRKLQ